MAEIDAIETGLRVRGFGRECPPAWCFKYVVFVRSNKVGEVLRLAELHAFLGEIDTQDEAILVVEALGYGWGDTREEAAIREVTDGTTL